MQDHSVVPFYPEDDDATQWQSEEERAQLIQGQLDEDDTTLVDAAEEMAPDGAKRSSFWRWAFG
ncbi:MAG TPA: hypothetical protein ENK40_05190 [Gammaproteobacteria bacterium]|nr:hypothetical protein [Gammaproteobacteria bacterium]